MAGKNATKSFWKYHGKSVLDKYGEKLMDRIEFEELALKNVDPSLGPELMRGGKPSVVLEERKKQRDLVSRLSCPTLWLIDDLTNPTLDTINTPNVLCTTDIAPTTSAYYAARESTDT